MTEGEAELGATLDAALHEVLDPETGVNLVDLGLIYGVTCTQATGEVEVRMTLTTPACPAADVMVAGVERRLGRVPGVTAVAVAVVFDPPWTPARITAAGRAQLGG